MYETKFDIMKGVEDGIEIFKKLIKPAMILALINFLIGSSRVLLDPTYKDILSGNLIVLDPMNQLMSQLISIGIGFISMGLGLMILYYYKETITGEIPLLKKIGSSYKVVVLFYLGLLVLMVPFMIIITLIMFGSFALDTSGILGVILIIILLIFILVFMPMLNFTLQAMIFDEMGVFKAMKHSFRLVKHNYFRLLLLMILLAGVSSVLLVSLKFHTIGIILSILISSITSKLFMCIYSAVYLQAKDNDTIEEV